MSKERLEIFSDAVFAIIMTLLVLELKVPHIADHSSWSQYIEAMAPIVPKIISFVLSFVTIAIHWVSHYYFFHHLQRMSLRMAWLNNLFLLWICFLPFPTAMLGDHPTDQFPIVLYGTISLLGALTFFAFRGYAVHAKLFNDDSSVRSLGPTHSVPAIALYSLAIIFAFVNVYISLLLFVIVPLLYFIPNFIHANSVKAGISKSAKVLFKD